MHNLLILDLFDFEYKLNEIINNHTDPDGLEIILLVLRNSPFIFIKMENLEWIIHQEEIYY